MEEADSWQCVILELEGWEGLKNLVIYKALLIILT
jgi:hypothetical protein